MVTLSNRIMVQTSWLPSLSCSHGTLSSREERKPWRVLRVGCWTLNIPLEAGRVVDKHTHTVNMEKLERRLFRESSNIESNLVVWSSQKRGDFGIQGSLLRLRGTGRWDLWGLTSSPPPTPIPQCCVHCLVGTQSWLQDGHRWGKGSPLHTISPFAGHIPVRKAETCPLFCQCLSTCGPQDLRSMMLHWPQCSGPDKADFGVMVWGDKHVLSLAVSIGQDFWGAEGTSSSSFYLRPPPLAQGPNRY